MAVTFSDQAVFQLPLSGSTTKKGIAFFSVNLGVYATDGVLFDPEDIDPEIDSIDVMGIHARGAMTFDPILASSKIKAMDASNVEVVNLTDLAAYDPTGWCIFTPKA